MNKKKILIGIVGLFLFIGVIAHYTPSSRTAVEGTQIAVPTARPTIVPTNSPTPTSTPTPSNTPTPIYIRPTATPAPINNSSSTSTQTNQPQEVQQQTCAGATALCSDGTCSYSAHHQGTCSHHGGVAQWY